MSVPAKWHVRVEAPEGVQQGFIRLAGSMGRRAYAAGYYDACVKLMPGKKFTLCREETPIKRDSSRVAPMWHPGDGDCWRVDILDNHVNWISMTSVGLHSTIAAGSKNYCTGVYCGCIDCRPGPAVRLINPKGKVSLEEKARTTMRPPLKP